MPPVPSPTHAVPPAMHPSPAFYRCRRPDRLRRCRCSASSPTKNRRTRLSSAAAPPPSSPSHHEEAGFPSEAPRWIPRVMDPDCVDPDGSRWRGSRWISMAWIPMDPACEPTGGCAHRVSASLLVPPCAAVFPGVDRRCSRSVGDAKVLRWMSRLVLVSLFCVLRACTSFRAS